MVKCVCYRQTSRYKQKNLYNILINLSYLDLIIKFINNYIFLGHHSGHVKNNYNYSIIKKIIIIINNTTNLF
jgi:hypothetical protein